MSDFLLILPVFIIFIAYIVRGLSGFGSGLIAIPLLSLFIPVHLAVSLITIIDFVASTVHGIQQREKIQWREVFRLLPFSILGIALGLTLFHSLDSALLKQMLGIFILAYALYSLWNPLLSKASAWWSVPAGTCGGIISTLFGTGGPFYIMYLKARKMDKGSVRANFAIIFLLDSILRIAGYVQTEIVTEQIIDWLFLGLPTMAVAMWIGEHWHHKIPAIVFSRLISIFLLFSGVLLVL